MRTVKHVFICNAKIIVLYSAKIIVRNVKIVDIFNVEFVLLCKDSFYT